MAGSLRNEETREIAGLLADIFRLLPEGSLVVISLNHLPLYFFVTGVSKGMAL